jgi:alpha-tubulin suppressor-like RCC1 family protein
MSPRLADLTIAILVVTAGTGCGDDDPSSPRPPPATPTQIGFTVQPSQALRDSVIAPAVQVEVRGASGARIAGATNTVTLALDANPAGAALIGTTSVAAVNGIATFANLRVTERGRSYMLVASSPSLTPDTSGVFDIVVPLNANVVVPGVEHTCAVVGSAVSCWGRNDSGELGDNTLVSKPLAARVAFDPPGGASFVGLALGGSHTCATTSVAELYCWGSNASGQLGIGIQDDRRMLPALVSGVAFSGVSAGSAHTCARTTPQPDSTYLYCWGANERGQLGDGTNLRRTAPVAVAGTIAFSAVTAGRNHTCAVATATGAAYCWGDNTFGQLGDGSTTARNAPVPVAGGRAFIELSAGGEHTCGVTGALEAYCWGANTYGQLGDGTTMQRTTPVLVTGGVSFSRIALGGEFSCAMGGNQKLYCWGRNADGELGLGSFVGHLTPPPVAGSINPIGIAGGERHACATTFDGVAYCWGSNAFGKLGDGTATTRPGPNVVVH